MSIDINDFTIREARPADADALSRLAELDSARVPAGRVLVGELDDELVAAVPIAGGPAIADPYRPTSALVSLLGLRAAQLRGLEDRRKVACQAMLAPSRRSASTTSLGMLRASARLAA
jgi:hypothetical protein